MHAAEAEPDTAPLGLHFLRGAPWLASLLPVSLSPPLSILPGRPMRNSPTTALPGGKPAGVCPGVSSRNMRCFSAGPQAAFPRLARRHGCRAPQSERVKVFPHPSRPRLSISIVTPLMPLWRYPGAPPRWQRLLAAPSSEPPGRTSHTTFITLGAKDLYRPFSLASQNTPRAATITPLTHAST